MRRLGLLIGLALIASACAQGLTEEEAQSQIDQSIANAVETTTTTTSSTTTTTPATTTTTAAPETTTTSAALPEFPPPRENLDHGGDTWAVVLAGSTGISDPLLMTAVLAANEAGYNTGPTDCDFGAAEALGFSESDQYYTVSVYFDTEVDANLARDAFQARGVGSTVAQVQTFCLD
jgi:hypothetical protein